MKVTTKKGDNGNTTLFGGRKVPKDHPLIELLGLMDEVQSVLGLVKTRINMGSPFIKELQKELYAIMADVAGAKKTNPKELDRWLRKLEREEERLLEESKIGNKFVIPGDSEAEAWCQFARSRVRTCERRLIGAARTNPDLSRFIPYLNRLSDYFFILGRSLLV